MFVPSFRPIHVYIMTACSVCDGQRCAGVIGQQPNLVPGQIFIYHSGAILPCPSGQMLGHFHFVDRSSRGTEAFDAVILPFKLLAPASYHPQPISPGARADM